jgi:hypothetical protein
MAELGGTGHPLEPYVYRVTFVPRLATDTKKHPDSSSVSAPRAVRSLSAVPLACSSQLASLPGHYSELAAAISLCLFSQLPRRAPFRCLPALNYRAHRIVMPGVPKSHRCNGCKRRKIKVGPQC